MTPIQELSQFVCQARFEQLAPDTLHQLACHLLDTLGCTISGVSAESAQILHSHAEEMSPHGPCPMVGGGRSSVELAALYGGSLVHQLGLADVCPTSHGVCHPADNVIPLLCAGDFAQASGRDLLTALALAVQVQVRLSEEASRLNGRFDAATWLRLSIAAGAARLLDLPPAQTADALAMAAAQGLPLPIGLPGPHWTAIASAAVAREALTAALLARRGIAGPPHVWEGAGGLEAALGTPLSIPWNKEGLDAIARASIKRYPAPLYAQPILQALLELRQQHALAGPDVDAVGIHISRQAFDLPGGGKFDHNRQEVTSRDEARRSLRYLAAAALLDGQFAPEQLHPSKIAREEIQSLLQRVTIRPRRSYSRAYPAILRSSVSIRMKDGRHFASHRSDYDGFATRPMPWDDVVAKFHRLSERYATRTLRDAIVQAVRTLPDLRVHDLLALLARVSRPEPRRPMPVPNPHHKGEPPRRRPPTPDVSSSSRTFKALGGESSPQPGLTG